MKALASLRLARTSKGFELWCNEALVQRFSRRGYTKGLEQMQVMTVAFAAVGIACQRHLVLSKPERKKAG